MLDRSRAADSGIKLEVNGKILDSCTELMKCIRILVKKSSLLQHEIVSQGKVSNGVSCFTDVHIYIYILSTNLY